ncbi:lipopolysaccharide biosynthesis protein [Chryseosolibacter indicus]|uniref:Oligosaccharide flippase family protein n=1 Tax=Chryseosolibacter indicus TaxID=2782351 RepID=A0ABS5VVM8_9BACT|nr:oligosaccharide flippase family protein [Chryseosolibacter indicus]MBT1705495.1 oligosaccharide flippase family protein [Chryseosolibacter indicus]
MISKNFIKNSVVYTISGTLPTASAIILLPFYVRNLSTSNFGILSIYLALALIIQIIVSFSFDTSIYIHYHEYKNNKALLKRFVSSAFTFILINGTILGALLLVVGDAVFRLIFRDQPFSFYPYGILALVTGVLQAILKVHSSFVQTQQQSQVYFWSNLFFFLLISVLTVLGFFFFPKSLIGPIAGRLLAALLVAGWAFLRIVNLYGIQFNYGVIKESFSFNFYSMIYQMLQWTMNYFDRILVSLFLPLSLVGIYGFVLSCLIVIEFVLNGLNNSFFPKVVANVISQQVKQSSLEINRYYYGLTGITIILVTGSILFFPILLKLFVKKKEYLEAIPYISYASIIYLFRSIRLYFGIPFGALKYTKTLPVIYTIVSSVKAILIVLLVKNFELYGVIFSSLIAFVVEIFLIYFDGRSRFKFKFNFFKIIFAPLLIAVLILILEPTFGEKFSLMLHVLYVLVSLVLLIWIFRREIATIYTTKIFK